MKFYWFGDSWVYGDELDRIPGLACWQDFTFASLVSKHFDAQCVNLGECGASLDDLPWQFNRAVSTIEPNDIAFFCLTSNHRVSFFDEQGHLCRIMPGNKNYSLHRPHPHANHWYRFFDSSKQRLYNQDRVVNLLYFWSQHLGLRCYFAHIFCAQGQGEMDATPDHIWLVKSNHCLADSILPVIDAQGLYLHDDPILTNDQWQVQKIAIDQYIFPNWQHPNVAGHAMISRYIIDCMAILNEPV